MLPEQPINYPEFVADQLLTAANLNDLFHYLDVQERATRMNLIGVGIVCGLEVSVNKAGTEVTISQGCGITSEGYLVRWEEAAFQNYKAYDASEDKGYPPFYSGSQQLPLDELKRAASEEGLTELSPAYLADKVALIFVELQVNDAKNCDPESCDDKGRNIQVTLRPLLIKRSDAARLGASGHLNSNPLTLPEIKMPRHHVPAADVFDSGDVFAGFQQVLSEAFLNGLEENLTLAYKRLLPLVKQSYATNPFQGLATDFSFLHNGTITVQQLLFIQYFYDLFSDMISAYEELRQAGIKLLHLCCPDENLFPRHLLLGLVSGGKNAGQDFRLPSGKAHNFTSGYRHYFLPSPAMGCHADMAGELRLLFKRLVLLPERFTIPGSEAAFMNSFSVSRRGMVNTPIRITPSRLGPVPLSEKSIPFYYNAAAGADKLYENWNFQRSHQGSAGRILSYHAADYNKNKEAEILQPLQYDLEPYNFLRIEGHVGHSFTTALATINQIRDANRLPFDVVALSADIRILREQLAAIATGTNKSALSAGVDSASSMLCHFQDLEALYDALAQGFLCQLCKEMKYYYEMAAFAREGNSGPATGLPGVPLLRQCDPAYRYRDNTIGALFEAFYKKLPPQYIEVDQFLSGAALGNATGNMSHAVTDNSAVLLGYALLYYIEKTSEILTASLGGFSIAAFARRYADLMTVARQAKEFHQSASLGPAGSDNELALAVSEDIIDHLDTLLYGCKDAQFISLYNDYKLRWIYLSMLQKFGYYVKQHPGIQHKAGVTMGGTFILVYHERARTRTNTKNIFLRERRAPAKPEEQDSVASGPGSMPQEAAGEIKAGAAQEWRTNSRKAMPDSIRRLDATKLRTSLSDRQMAIMDKLFFKDIITRHALEELTAQLPDRIVIADFFLPYSCCSDCPPVYYVVNERKEEEPVSISINPHAFCQQDSGAYPVSVSPAGGSAAGEGLVQVNGGFAFHPADVSIDAADASKEVTLTYAQNNQQVQTTVKVYQQPSAGFQIRGVITHVDPNAMIFTAENSFPADYEWDFGDGQTATGQRADHRYEQGGAYMVQLTVTNGPCKNTSRREVVIQETPAPDKSCTPLSDILALFGGLKDVNKTQFKSFARIYGPYREVGSYFEKLEGISNAPVAQQLDFFLETGAAALLEAWFQALNPLVQESDVRQVALALWQVLSQLALYLMCIQEEDLGKGKIDLSALFKQLEADIRSWRETIRNFSSADKAQLQLLLDDMAAEADSIRANGAAEKKKKNYLSFLESCMAMLKEYLK